MAIQFFCPSCGQPIEIDDVWGGKLVSCPFCRNTVSAPTTSTLESVTPVVTARPTGTPVAATNPATEPASFSVPLNPPAPHPRRHQDAGTNKPAIVGLIMSLCWIASFILMEILSGPELTKALGENPATEEVRAYFNQLATSGDLPRWVIVMFLLLVVGTLFWILGVVFTIIGVTKPGRRYVTIFSGLILVLFPLFVCGGI